MKFRVVLDTGQRMNVGGLVGRFQEEISVSAGSEQEAKNLAREQKPGMRVVRVLQVFAFHITLRGRDDKRKRETFIIKATNEEDAKRFLAYNTNACRFARVISKKSRDESIVKIERRELA